MSTLRATNIKHESSATNQIVLGSDGSIGGTLGDTLAAKLDATSQKIIQMVRSADSTLRTTTSTSFVDANISVTISPTRTDSVILLLWSVFAGNSAGFVRLQLTNASNSPITGAEQSSVGNSIQAPFVLVGYSTPGTTGAVTYKGRFNVSAATGSLFNSTQTGQLFAFEVSA